jgi:hypothetical protein
MERLLKYTGDINIFATKKKSVYNVHGTLSTQDVLEKYISSDRKITFFLDEIYIEDKVHYVVYFIDETGHEPVSGILGEVAIKEKDKQRFHLACHNPDLFEIVVIERSVEKVYYDFDRYDRPVIIPNPLPSMASNLECIEVEKNILGCRLVLL